jgi:preprotein translocase subunit SecE
MGRLLRKKTSIKKKKQPGDEAIASASSDGSERQTALSAVSSSDVQKKQALPPKKPLSLTKPAPQSNTNTFVSKSTQFLREVKAELKKVTWPSRKQTLGSTVVVIVLVMMISLFLGVVDIALSSLVHVVLG